MALILLMFQGWFWSKITILLRISADSLRLDPEPSGEYLKKRLLRDATFNVASFLLYKSKVSAIRNRYDR